MKTSICLLDGEKTLTGDVKVADTFFARLAGLQMRRSLPPGTGLLLVPCGSVHTFFMAFAIDLVWLDREGRVLRTDEKVSPWRVRKSPKGTLAVLELPAGQGAAFRTGTRLQARPVSSEALPGSVDFLSPGA